jgi:capsular polysaccharide biosynthesis protein
MPMGPALPSRIEHLANVARTGVIQCTFSQMEPASVRTPRAPAFLFGTVPGAVLNLYHSRIGMFRKGAWLLHDVELSGEFILTAGDVALADNLSNIHHSHIDNYLKRRDPQRQLTKRRLPGRHIMLGGPGMHVYGHWLIEILPKLYVLDTLGYDLNSVSFVLPSNLRPFALKWLAILGIGTDQISLYDPENEIVQIDELVVASVLHNGVRVSPAMAEVGRLLVGRIERTVGQLRPSTFGAKVFLSRKKAGGRNLINRDAIENIALDSGFAIISPETLDITEQVILLKGARYILGEYGSALHGSIFSGSGTVVCALRGSTLHPGFIQSGIGFALRQPTGYVFGQSESAAGPERFTISEDDFRSCLRLAMSDITLEETDHSIQPMRMP